MIKAIFRGMRGRRGEWEKWRKVDEEKIRTPALYPIKGKFAKKISCHKVTSIQNCGSDSFYINKYDFPVSGLLSARIMEMEHVYLSFCTYDNVCRRFRIA